MGIGMKDSLISKYSQFMQAPTHFCDDPHFCPNADNDKRHKSRNKNRNFILINIFHHVNSAYARVYYKFNST
jgi:hypothetical protein